MSTAAADDAFQLESSPVSWIKALATPLGRQSYVHQKAVEVTVSQRAKKKLCNYEKIDAGVITSANLPDSYPNNLVQTHLLHVEEGSVLSLQLTTFDVEVNGESCVDSVTVTDGDGTTLMDKTCGGSTYGHLVIGGQSQGSLLPNIKSSTNIVMITFTTKDNNAGMGWNLTWSAIPTGKRHYIAVRVWVSNLFGNNFS